MKIQKKYYLPPKIVLKVKLAAAKTGLRESTIVECAIVGELLRRAGIRR